MIPDELRRAKPLTGKERLGANRDSEYLGAEDLDPEIEPVLTIKALYYAQVTLARGKEWKDVIVFEEEKVPGINVVRPLIVNATNRKTLRKIYKNVTADALCGKQIQLFLEHGVRDPSTGDKIDGIRIRPRVPVVKKAEPIKCFACGKDIQPIGKYSAEDIARINEQRFGKRICGECSKKIQENIEKETSEETATEATE